MHAAPTPPVPAAYTGLWQRSAIRRSNGETDLTTLVLWFQSQRFHIDLRIPQARPVLRDAGALARLDAAALAQFEAQTAFAGVTVVEAALCSWHPEIAFPFLSDAVDAGLMTFKGADALHEAGVDGSYDEDWQRLANAPVTGWRLHAADGDALAYVLCDGAWLAYACGRADDRFRIGAPSWTECGFARRDGRQWRIHACNNGWREGTTIDAAELFDDSAALPGATVRLALPAGALWRVTDFDAAPRSA
jgi:hypothetical protein